MTVRIGVDSNIDEVIASIEEVKEDIPYEMRKRVGATMRVMRNDAQHYVQEDSNWTGDLMNSLELDESTTPVGVEFSLSTSGSKTPYAAIVEFGSGSRSDIAYDSLGMEYRNYAAAATSFPPGFQYESPDIDYNKDNPFNFDGYSDFYGFAKYIQEWMATKPVAPENDRTQWQSAVLIARAIVEHGNYAHPFMRPAYWDNELQIRQAARHAVRNATR